MHYINNIVLLNADGKAIGTKPREAIDKKKDILHTIAIIGHWKEKFLLSRIPLTGKKTYLYPGKWSFTAATLLRSEETPEDAAHRALQNELHIQNKVRFVGEKFCIFSDNSRLLSCFLAPLEEFPQEFNRDDTMEIRAFLPQEIQALETSEFSEHFLKLWELFLSK